MQLHKYPEPGSIYGTNLHKIKNDGPLTPGFGGGTKNIERASRDEIAAAAQRHFVSVSMHKDR